MQKEQENASLQHKVNTLEEQLEKVEAKVGEGKQATQEAAQHKDVNENLLRKISLLEGELDSADKNLRETTDRLRQTDVKAEHFERQVQRLEQERDQCVTSRCTTRHSCLSGGRPSMKKLKANSINPSENLKNWPRNSRVCRCVTRYKEDFHHDDRHVIKARLGHRNERLYL